MGKNDVPPPAREPEPVNLREALEERYLAYALSTIMGRALPDARDGLKPVHRRILYGMRILRLDPGTAFKKCAKIVGDVMGSFHPHGDQAIYEALVRLAQDFASRYPLVDGQGNFGNIDGDGAAAYRYTEARMTEVARCCSKASMRTRSISARIMSGDQTEPVVLPAAFPNLLANGSQGIAVGMATSIPPHNVAELCDACLHLIAHNNATDADLLKFVPGPDFPTGGIIVDFEKSRSPRLIAPGVALSVCARNGSARKRDTRYLQYRRHRNSLHGAEVTADREDRRASGRQETAARRRHPRRIRPRICASSSNRASAPSIRR